MFAETNKKTIRVMLDSNVFLSALLFPSLRMNALIKRIEKKYQLTLSSFVIEELKNVVSLKFPDMMRPHGSFGYHPPLYGILLIHLNQIQAVALSKRSAQLMGLSHFIGGLSDIYRRFIGNNGIIHVCHTITLLPLLLCAPYKLLNVYGKWFD
jgi:hypothetical protein